MNAIIERLNSAGSLFVNFSAVMLVQASILILILLALDFILRKKVRAVFRYCIWLLVLVKLIIPPSISSPIGVGNLFGDKLSEVKIDQIETPGQVEQAGTIIKVPPLAIIEPKPELYKQIDPSGTHLRSLEWQKEQAKIIETSTAQVEEQQKNPVTASVSISWQGTAFLAWAIVLLILILLLIQRAMFVRGLLAQADGITGGLNDLVQSCGRLLGMKEKVRLKTSANATSPAVCGLFRPVILLPQNLAPNLTKEQLKAVLLHELIHIKRGDLWINLFQALLQMAYFYNPFVWLANAIIRRVREQAVDEAVQVALGKSAESYPQILVNVAKLAFKRPALSLRLIGVVESKSALKNRIARMISRPVPKKAKLGLVGLISVFLVAVVLLPMAAARNEESITEPDKSKFKATLFNGVKVELVGVCEHPSGDKQWWRPDGSLMNHRPYEKIPYVLSKDETAFEFFAKAFSDGQSFELDSLYIEGAEKEGETYRPNITLPVNTQAISRAIALPENVEQCDVEVGIYLGRWQTQARSKGDELVLGPDREYAFSEPIAQPDDSVRIVLSHDPPEGNLDQRLVVIDKDGNIHESSFEKRTSTSKLEQYQVIFKNVKLKNIKEFQFQTRPYEWLEFKNVSVKPNFKTDVEIEVKIPGKSINGQKPGESADDRRENADRIGKVTFKEGTSIRDALQFIARAYKKNIIISDKVSGQVPITEIYDMTFEELLEAVLGTHKYVVDGNLIRVYTAEEFESLYPNFETGVKIEDSAEQDENNIGSISGKVLDGENNPVADAIVLICEKQTGIPLTEGDYLPFTKGYLQGQQKKPTFAKTDSGGNFSFENLPQGEYRLIVQSWPGVKEIGDIFEVKSPIVNLNGTADNINITAGETEQVTIKPLGTGSLMINQDMPNDETLAVLSKSPTRADPILGFAGWTGDFLQNMLCGNRMPEGRTIINGLPEGKIYIAMFAADSVPGWTEAQADIKANRTTGLPYVPFVNSWSNSRHEPPEELVPIFNEIKSLTSTQQNVLLMNSYKAVGLELSEEGGMWGFMAEIVDHLEKPMELPSGRKAAFGEVMAAAQYIQLQKTVENKNKRIARQNEQSRQVQNSTQRSPEAESENNLQELIDSARAGQR